MQVPCEFNNKRKSKMQPQSNHGEPLSNSLLLLHDYSADLLRRGVCIKAAVPTVHNVAFDRGDQHSQVRIDIRSKWNTFPRYRPTYAKPASTQSCIIPVPVIHLLSVSKHLDLFRERSRRHVTDIAQCACLGSIPIPLLRCRLHQMDGPRSPRRPLSLPGLE